ncbi:MAG: isopeptide-forming domain-containing fimbrial protein [Planctomycetota bacterium]
MLKKTRSKIWAEWLGVAFGVLALLLGMASPALGAEKFCSDAPYFGVIDGNIRPTPTQITIDCDCTFQNFPQSKPLTTTVNFHTNDTTIYLIIYDNVYFTGHMACASVDHRIWFSNSSDYGSSNACQDLFIPVETIDKKNPQTTATIGVPFTYTLTLPSMSSTGEPSANKLHSVTIWDDLTATGADLTYQSDSVYLVSGPTKTLLGTNQNMGSDKNLEFNFSNILAGDQIVIEITVVLDDTPTNVAGTQFTNTAKWKFGRYIDGVFYEPLPGEWGQTAPMTIVEPDLVVTKTGPTSVINLGEWAEFTIDVWNSGTWAGDAWNVKIVDRLPSEPSNSFNGGMCDMTPEVTGVTLAGRPLTLNDYLLSYTGCELSLTLLEAAGPIGPNERLIITYQTKVDADSESGAVLTNIAAATLWSNDKDNAIGQTYTCPLTNGTEGTPDCQDAHDLLVVLSGYFFEKTVANPDTGELVTSAMPGNTLRYTLRLRSIDEPFTGLRFYDDLGVLNTLPAFEPGSLTLVSYPVGADTSHSDPDGGTNNAGILDIRNLSVPAGGVIEVKFDITLASTVPEDFVVLNQADLIHGTDKIADSDDPNIHGQADPDVEGDEDPTQVVIYFPQPLPPLKETLQTTATIGEEVTYRLTVPGTVSTRPLYDVVITDPLDPNLEYVSATVTGVDDTSVSNTSTPTQMNIAITEIPAGQQALIELRARVGNVMGAQQGVAINNTVSYTYANSSGGTTRPPLTSGTVTLHIVEPHIATITKSANPTTPTAGEIVRYSVTLTASGGTYSSDVFDVTIIDNLSLGLAYAGNPTVTVGTGVGADNTIGPPVITGEGSTIPQTLVWSLNSANADIDIAEGTSVTISYDVRVLDNVLASQALTNSVVAQWTSIDGLNNYERNGTDGIGELNDYVTEAATATVTTRDINATITKERTNDTYGAGDANVRIGDIVEYELRLSVPEGTLGNLELIDILPQGLKFEGTVSINGHTGPAPYATVAPFTHTAIPEANEAGDPAVGPTTVTWSLGFVTNQPNDGLSNDFLIVYRGRVLNEVFAHTDLSITLNNVVDMTYDKATGRVTQTDEDTITALQPMLTVSKSSNPVSGSSIAAGNTVTYTVDIQNTGTAPAYDVVLQDIIPLGTRVGGVTMVSTYLVSSPTPGLANLAPVYDSTTGVATWDFDSGVYMIPAGDTLRVVYSVLADTNLGAGLTLTNQATVNWYYSFDNEAPPTLGVITGEREIYGPTNTASTTLVTGVLPAKTLLSPATPEATIGQEVVYQITVPGTVSTNAMYDVVITDPLDPNLEYVSATVTGSVVGVSNNSIPTQMNIAITEIPAGQQAVIELHARVRNVMGAQQSVAINNTVSYTYANSSGGTTQPALTSGTMTVNIVEPNIATITKSANPTTATAGEIVRYSATLTASSGTAFSDVFDVTITDELDLGLAYDGNPTVTVGTGVGADNAIGPPVITGDGINQAQILVWSLNSGNADIDIAEGTSVTISYDVRVLDNVLASQALTNSVVAQWTSIDGLNNYERNGTDGIGELNDYVTASASASVSMPPPGVLSKASTQASAAIGEKFTYIITVPATPVPTALHDVQIMDNLAATGVDLRFVSAEVVAGSSWTGTLVNSGSDTGLVEIVAQDINNGIEIPANGQIQVAITAMLLNTERNMTLDLSFTNRAWYTYSNGTDTLGSDDTTGATSDSMTVAHPTMTMTKTGPVPATMRIGTPATFTLDVQNTGTSDAWNVTVTEWLPNPTPGGMCDTGMSGVSATIYQADGTTPVLPLIAGTHYDTSFTMSGTEQRCEFVLTLKAPAVVAPGHRLIVTYSVGLDADNIDGTTLTNIAGATQWLGTDPSGTVYHTYVGELTGGTVGTLDHQDAYSVTVQGAILATQKTVENLTTGQSGANASPEDRLRYTITIENTTDIPLSNFSLVDEIDGLNASPMFQPGSIENVSVPVGASYVINGGTLTVNNLNIGANEMLTVSFEAVLAPVITNGTIVLNQGQLILNGIVFGKTDDPNVSGDENPTETLITSAPIFQVQKTSTIMEGDPNILMAGETLRYTITIKNIGTEDANNVILRDYTPGHSTYVGDSTTLNGIAVPDPSPGINSLHTGIPVNAPENTTAGYLRADATPGATNVATIIFDVVVDPNAMNGLIIENQGFVNGSGAGSGPQPEQPSDDPNTPIPDDPTRDVVGNVPLVDALKTVQILGSDDIVDPGDRLHYTITITNAGAAPATGAVFTDAVPVDTTYVRDSVQLNGLPVGRPDGGISPLVSGIDVSSSDLTPPLPSAGNGTLSLGSTAVVTFDVQVNSGVSGGTVISNQGYVTSNEQSTEPTDADGIDSNGDQPTQVVVGDAQVLSILKEVFVVGGGAAVPGSQLEYVIRVTNIGSLPATGVKVTDAVPVNTTYVPDSVQLNGLPIGQPDGGISPLVSGIDVSSSDLTPPPPSSGNGTLSLGESAAVRFLVQIDPAVAIGKKVENTGIVTWDDAGTASASVSLDVGGTLGSASLNGDVWHDANLDKICDHSIETLLEGWSVELYYNNQLVTTVTTDANGAYRLNGLIPNEGTSDLYELRFLAAVAGPNTASMGDGDSLFTNGPQRISDIIVSSGANLQDLNLPLWPNGAVYNSVVRSTVAGARVALLNATTGAALPSRCFDDPVQQNQITALDGFYKFDLNFSDASCPAGGAYLIEVSPPATGYEETPSQIIPPASDENTAPFSIPACPGSADDAVTATEYCEVVASAAVPPPSIPPRTANTVYHLHLLLRDGNIPDQKSQVFNNSIPIDPELDGAVAITKTSSLTNVTRGTLVPYTITVTNVYGAPLYDISVVDRFPAGFKYMAGSARLDGNPAEPRINGRELVWDDLELQVNQKYTIQLLLVVGSGVSEGEYINRAVVLNTGNGAVYNSVARQPVAGAIVALLNATTGGIVSGEATATVRVIPDPDFDCTDVIGKVFDDRNLNGQQDPGEQGLPGVRVVTVRGLIATTDKHGRFHITCAAVPDEDRGSNFILKVDERCLPTGYRLTTENPRVQRATRGKMIRFNFGATIHRVVRIDIGDGVFESDTSLMRMQWIPKITQLLEELKKSPSVLRLSYLGDVERKGLVEERLEALKKKITKQWKQSDGGYRLAIETEIFWRRGTPLAGQ